MRKLNARAAVVALTVLPLAARAQGPCKIVTTAPPAVTETVTCSESAISQFFLDSPGMAQLGADQRDAVMSHPLRYAFAYMTADAANRLQLGFVNQAVQSIDYKAFLETKGKAGTASHEIFDVRMDRATAGKIDWSGMAPGDLFKEAPSHLSPWLTKNLAAEDEASLGEPPGKPGK